QGNTNVTNGCINLSTEDAEQYFYSAVYGDPVEVTGSSIQLSYSDGDIWDWAVGWDTWVSMSELSAPEQPRASLPSTAPATPTDAPTLSGTPTSTAIPTRTPTSTATPTSTSTAPTSAAAGG
ncbi:MAG TPA: L,D-transpeptidase, partial [Mycobacterium sp.]|nr:L,D-transpeptidase [Mycobacterium sp.]